jgi:5-(carboxyamino)imidazole ribonucleotide synthase
MVNFLGLMPTLAEVLAVPGAHLHDYGKDPRPQRKLGHCTVVRDTATERGSALERILRLA